MTFTEIVTEVMERTRQTSTEAQTRVGREVNDRYRRVTSSVGLQTSRPGSATASTNIAGPHVTFDLEKVISVRMVASSFRRMLAEITHDDLLTRQTVSPVSGPPTFYAILKNIGNSVEVHLYPQPDAVYALTAEGLRPSTVLTGSSPPLFPASFHDVLMHGALADEWTQLKQDDLAARSEAVYEQRLAELRYFIAKSAYLDIHQGARGQGFTRGDYLPGYFVPRWW
ncbi:MAG TPA: hypothetical protein VFZ53_07610 [Polyangiaceae bacterium]